MIKQDRRSQVSARSTEHQWSASSRANGGRSAGTPSVAQRCATL